MNELNSIIVDGYVSSSIDGKGVFGVITTRHYTKESEHFTEKTPFKCLVPGSFLKMCSKNLKVGRNVRIVGRLSMVEGTLGVYVEHLEFKPGVNYTFKKD